MRLIEQLLAPEHPIPLGLGHRKLLTLGLATQISLLGVSLSWQLGSWAAPPVNTVNDGRIVNGGTYLNTADSKTTFINSGNGGLWVQPGATVRGLESNANGVTTNNGGTIEFYAPDNVVRIDGTVNVNALLNNAGAFNGIGGKVFVDAAYLINNGNIFASGINGGLVQANVAAMTMNSTGQIFAHGYGGTGGVVSVNSSGPVDIKRGAVIDSSGGVGVNLDTNVINLEGSIVNVEGVLRADGVTATAGSRGGTIRLVATGRTDLTELQNAFTAAGKTNPKDPTSTPTLSSADQSALLSRASTLVSTEEGSVNVGYRSVSSQGTPTGGWISANGSNGIAAKNNDLTEDNTSRAGDGGTIIIAADQNAHIRGIMSANGGIGANGSTTLVNNAPNPGVGGGDGGTVSIVANRDITVLNTAGQLSGATQANGGTGGQTVVASLGDLASHPSARGGNGGLIAFSANSGLGNHGTVSALGGRGGAGAAALNSAVIGFGGNGGQGGLIAFSNNGNPIGNGILNDSGGQGGAGSLGNSQGGLAGLIVTPNPSTLSSTQTIMQNNGAAGNASSGSGTVKTTIGQTQGDELLTHADNLIWLRRNTPGVTHPADISGILFSNQGIARSVSDLNGQGNALKLILAKSPSDPYDYKNFTVGSSASNLLMSLARPFPEDWNGLSKVANLTVANNGGITFPGSSDFWTVNAWAGGHISALALGDINNNENGYQAVGTIVGGTINLASRQNINPYDLITTQALNLNGGTAFHNGSIMMKADGDIEDLAFMGGTSQNALIGESIRLRAGHDFINLGTLTANAGGQNAHGPSQGGIINIHAGNMLRVGNALLGGPTTLADGLGTAAWGGYVFLGAKTIATPSMNYVQVSGTMQNGRIVTDGTIQIDPPD